VARRSATRPWHVLLLALVVLACSTVSLSQLRITSSLSAMLGTDSAAAAAMERVTTEYRTGDALLLLVELPADRPADDAGRDELVAFATSLERALKADPVAGPLIAQVRFREDQDLRRFMHEIMLPGGVFYLSESGAAELLQRLEPERMREQIARNEAMIGAPGPAGIALSGELLRDPLRLLELVPQRLRGSGSGSGGTAGHIASDEGNPEFSEDGRALLLHIGASHIGSDYEAAGRLVDAVVRCAAAENRAGLRVAPAGSTAIARDSSRVIRRDSIVSCLVSVGFLYLLFRMFYRRWIAGLLIGGVAAVGMLAGIGALALVVREVSPLAAMIAALLAGLGTDYGIHFLSHHDGYRARGFVSVDASVETARQMAVPIGTNCFTSIFGFISLWPSQIQMLSDFAVMGAAGLIGALIAVFVLMPAALALLDRDGVATPTARDTVGRLTNGVARWPRTCMASSLMVLGVLVVAATAQGSGPRFESDLTVLHPRPSPALETTAEIIRRFSTQGDLVPIEVQAGSPAALVAAAHETARALDAEECRSAGMSEVIGLHMLLPDPRDAAARAGFLRATNPDHVIASFDAAIAESLFEPAAYQEYRQFLRALVSAERGPSVADVLRYRSLAERAFPTSSAEETSEPTRTVLIARFSTPLHDRAHRKAAMEAMNSAVAGVSGGTATVAGVAAVSQELEDAARVDLPRSIGISLVLVCGWLMLVFRRPLDVLLALTPLTFAACATVLVLIATGQRVNPINMVAIPLLDGIAVDAGVFLVAAARTHCTSLASLRVHLRSTVHAVLLSVGTTMTAFAALCFTHTPAIQSLGLVSAIGIAASGIGAILLLLPILILRAAKQRTS
jgi:predicted RND superfamily exporter protein